MSNARQISVEIIFQILNNKVFFSEAKAALKVEENADISFINMLVLTTLRRLTFIKKVLYQFLKKRSTPNLRFVDCALYVAAAEMLFLETPDYAVINSYVEIVKKKQDKYTANFTNGVLRNLARIKDKVIWSVTSEFFPPEFIKVLQGYTREQIRQIEEYSAQEAPLDLSFKSLEQAKIWSSKLDGTLLPNGSIRLENNGKISALPGYQEGAWWVQDFAASLPVLSLGKVEGLQVLDLCAAPGGKTAQLISRGAITTALDISKSRLQTLSENLQRLNLTAQDIICCDALEYLKGYKEPLFDIILLDAPCSASGTLRRHPELVHIKSANDIKQAARLQRQLLEMAGKALKEGGILLYTVCSIAKAEGEEQIQTFLEQNTDYRLLPIKINDIDFSGSKSLSVLISPQGYIRTLPYYSGHQGGMDSFFVAKLQKVKNS